MLRIIKATEKITIDRIAVGIYALPGIGKTTLAYTANKPLLLDFDRGSHRAKNRKDTVPIASWDDVAQMTREDLEPFETLIVDTVGRQLDFLSADIVSKNPKHGNAGNLSLQGYGVLKGRFTAWLNLMKTYGKDIVLVAHMDEKMEGDITKERIDVQGGSKSEIYKTLDAFGKLYIEGKQRKLDFSPREGSLGKNPAQMDILIVPDYQKDDHFLATVIADIKKSINALSDEQQKAFQEIEDWRKVVAGAKTPSDFNKLIESRQKEGKQGSPAEKRILLDAATALGFKFDKERGIFTSDEDLTAVLEKSVENAKGGDLDAPSPFGGPEATPEPTDAPRADSGPAEMFPVEYVDPDKDRCPECKSSFGIHVKICSHFVDPNAKKSGAGATKDSITAYDLTMIQVKEFGTAKAGKGRNCEFTYRREGKTHKFEATNWHRSLFPILDGGIDKVFDLAVHEDKGKFIIDDVLAVDGVEYVGGVLK